MTTATMTQPEIRLLAGAELRASDEGQEKGFTGRVVPYNVFAPIGGTFEEAIAPRCFAKSIQEAAGNLPLMSKHDHQAWPIGRSVEWDDRPEGLWGRWVMADTEEATQVHHLVKSGVVRGLSVGFLPMRDQEDWVPRQPPLITTVVRRQARLVEVSVVPIPTWAEAVITVTRSSVAAPGTRLTPRVNAWQEWLATVR